MCDYDIDQMCDYYLGQRYDFDLGQNNYDLGQMYDTIQV